MVELLLAAFIMGIGLLGLSALQMLSIRTAGVGARMGDAVRLGEMVMEAASAEATQSILGERYQNAATAPKTWLGSGATPHYYKYRAADDAGGAKGSIMDATDATDGVFTVTVTQTNQANTGRGQITRLDVQVVFTETLAGGTAVNRTVQLFREVAHA
ncbi:MAG: hypothetical protein HYZ13_10295 [Acidobacteria bacterium]|nr:hypothetical protein [Acidobacteriota bacterium]